MSPHESLQSAGSPAPADLPTQPIDITAILQASATS